MNHILKLLSVVAMVGLMAAYSEVASAQATRTWVSGVGDDVNPCSRTAPCKTFAGAISKTAVDGIINCVDPGGFGAVTITKGITIDCTTIPAGVLASGTNGVNVIVGATDVVTLRGLSIEGAGSGLVGVNVTGGGSVHVEKSRIFGFRAGSASGIRFAPNSTASLFVSDSFIVDNGVSGTGGGIIVRGTGGNLRVTVRNTEITDNAAGIVSDTTAGATVLMHVIDSAVSSNDGAGVSALAGNFNSILLERSTASQNGGAGISMNGSSAQVLLTNSTIMSNNVGISLVNGATGYSYLTNQISANGTDGNVPLPNSLNRY